MTNTTLMGLMEAHSPHFSKGQRRIADFITARYDEAAFMTAARLGELCGKDKADVSRMMSIMEKKELVKKEGSSYRARLMLTPAGMEAAEHVRSRATLAVERASRGLSDERRAVFYEALELIVSNLQNICEEGLPL